jgi:hypothetical protein
MRFTANALAWWCMAADLLSFTAQLKLGSPKSFSQAA